ncbi:hypothetical protein CAPTEDRAFT_181464 [Capitella teleta]|uniref:Thioredoxin domain-containing protein n=1 Tax=Capitella teleta TaxID=283909 RepID=R7USW0_CAPTE|nr:hypothetical protein CAPTEDRAFT_181464 [Capitella teleta]|eukprot:ELU09559.1 hypothetical protein CAPTEDRAFT_181464 [Capitella teleta]
MSAVVPPPREALPPTPPPPPQHQGFSQSPSYTSTLLAFCPAHDSDFTFPYLLINALNKAKHIKCVARDLKGEPLQVEIVNSHTLLQHLGAKNGTDGHCYVVLFFAPWCTFCARMAPHYNAIARAFPDLHVLAINAAHFSNLNSRYGTISVPNVLIFHNSKAVARFNKSFRTLKSFSKFIHNITGIRANASVTVMPWDHEGPLPSSVLEEADHLLWLSWAFVFLFSCTVFCRSTAGQRVFEAIRDFGHEHHHHQHID